MKLSLEAWRKARGKSQDEMANICGVHVNTYRRWEENPGEIRYDKALKIVGVLNIRLDDILLPSDTTETSKSEETA